jgi:hypothetical protein
VRFHAVAELSDAAILQVQEQVRRRVLKAFVRWGLLEAHARDEMLGWRHGGGFSLDASVRIAADDRVSQSSPSDEKPPCPAVSLCRTPDLALNSMRLDRLKNEA